MAEIDPRKVARVEHRIGRYEMYGEIASGGMATVHFGRLVGDAGFVRTVAIKRLHPHYAKIPQFSAKFVDEAHLAARIRHPNVVATLDTVAENDELLLVMEYVPGQSLAELQRACRSWGERVPVGIALRLATDALYGLHAAHTATGEDMRPLLIVHRDVSPQNILVGVDGMARVLDFGIAKAVTSVDTTQQGQLKGKLRYMSPEQVCNAPLSARTDVYALSVVLWELLTGDPLFNGSNDAAILAQLLAGVVHKPSTVVRHIPVEVDDIVMRGLQRDPSLRFESAHEMAVALESAMVPALSREVSQWMQRIAAEAIAWRAQAVAAIEQVSTPSRAGRAPTEMGSSPALSAPEPSASAPALPLGFEPTMPALYARGPRPEVTEQNTITDLARKAVTYSHDGGAPPIEPRGGSKQKWPWGIAILSGALAVAFGVASLRAPAPGEPGPLPDGRAASGAAAASVSAPSASASASSFGLVPQSPPSAEASASAPRPSGKPSQSTRAPRGPTPVRAAAPEGNACNPPYFDDAQGIRHIKQECLKFE